MTNPKIWFITGSSRGFGRALTEAALRKGDVVIATARNPKSLAGLVETYRDRIYPLALDVSDESAVSQAVEEAKSRYGCLDVVVNNAGYGDIAVRPGARRTCFCNAKEACRHCSMGAYAAGFLGFGGFVHRRREIERCSLLELLIDRACLYPHSRPAVRSPH